MKFKFILFILSLSLLLSSCSSMAVDDTIRVTILDIGKADCIVLQGFNQVMIIDAGEEEDLPKICAFLEREKIEKIDTLILSHFDKDHIGGASHLIREYGVEKVIQSTFDTESTEYSSYQKALEDKGLIPQKVKENTELDFGTGKIRILPPEKTAYDRKEDNNASLVVRLEYGETGLYFFGDALEERIDEFLASNPIAAQFAKLPHHGTYLENYPELLDAIQCTMAAITCSKKNMPDEATLELLDKKQIETYLTQNGDVSLVIDSHEINMYQS